MSRYPSPHSRAGNWFKGIASCCESCNDAWQWQREASNNQYNVNVLVLVLVSTGMDREDHLQKQATDVEEPPQREA